MALVEEKAHRAADRAPILVTGSHRSGTTWVGRMLAASPGVGYIREPFNVDYNRPGVCSAPFAHWFQYVTAENEDAFLDAFARTLRFSYDVSSELQALRSLKDAARTVRDWGRFLYYRTVDARPLMKDPIAFFSAEWLAARFDMDVIVMIRHPAAFASSLKRLGWTFDFSQFLEQPLLMRDHLHPFEEEIRTFADQQRGIIDQAVLLWRLIHHVVATYQAKHPGWIFIRHEDLSRQPREGFQRLYEALHLDFTPGVDNTLRAHTSTDNPREAPENVDHHLKRDSRANIWSWKDRLTEAEIAHIRAGVEDIASRYYGDEDW